MLGIRHRWRAIPLIFSLLLLALSLGCRKELPELFDRNQPPETYISAAPVESLIDGYQVAINWYAYDPDGEIAYYMWAWTDSSRAYYSAWNPETQTDDRLPGEGDFDATHFTTRTDSVFILKANDGGGMSRDLTFSVTAVDDHGKRDPVPARLYFEASVDHRPEIVWSGEPEDTLDVGQPFEATFTYDPATVNGGFLGFHWQSGSETDWHPMLTEGEDAGTLVWSKAHPDYADADEITLNFTNNVAVEDSTAYWSAFYQYGSFQIKAQCIDLAGVTSEIDTDDRDNLQGAVIPILNRDPDTRLRPIEGADVPVVVTYLDADEDEQTLQPEVRKITEWHGQPLDPGFHYQLTDTIPWGPDTKIEFHFQGWDQDSPVLAEKLEEPIRFQMDYLWTAPNLNLPTLPFEGNSGPRFPEGGLEGLDEDFEIPGETIYQPAGQAIFMNVGPFDYVVRGYANDSWGRTDGTPTTVRFTGGFTSSVTKVELVSSRPTGIPSVPGETIILDLTALAADNGGELTLALVPTPDTSLRHYFEHAPLEVDTDAGIIYVRADTTYDGAPITAALPDDWDPLKPISTHKLIFRVSGQDDPRNGSSAVLGRSWYDLVDPDYGQSRDQFPATGHSVLVGFDIVEMQEIYLTLPTYSVGAGNFLQVWTALGEIGDLGTEDSFECSLEFAERVYRSHFMGTGDYEQPDYLGEKSFNSAFCNTVVSNLEGYGNFPSRVGYVNAEGGEEIQAKGTITFVTIGRVSPVDELGLNIVYTTAPAYVLEDPIGQHMLPPEAP